jgi:hyperosmotically inducible periplasmic protein
MKSNLLRTATFSLALALAGAAAGATTTAARTHSDPEIAAKAAREIRMYSRYTIWDNVKLAVRDGSLELLGHVSQPFKKADLERLALRVPGVTSVTNRLQVLPTSFHDDELRVQVARAIYGHPAFTRYAIQAVPPIHIIVNNGEVTLEGVVNNELEKNLAYHRASGAGLSFGKVVNNLQVENAKPKA